MALKTQKQVLAGLDRMNSQRVSAMAATYKKKVIGPMVKRFRKARGNKELLGMLGAGLFKEMDAEVVEQAVEETTVQAGLIGRVTATPRNTKPKE